VASSSTKYKCAGHGCHCHGTSEVPIGGAGSQHRQAPGLSRALGALCAGYPGAPWERSKIWTRVHHGTGPSYGWHIPHHAEQGNLSPVSLHKA
jgi:hypothetical protein